MAITVTTPGVSLYEMPAGAFILNGVSADASGCEELKAAPGAGLSICVSKLTISNNSAGTLAITIGEGETVPGSVDTALIGPISLLTGQTIPWEFKPAMKLTANKSLVVDAGGAGAICVFVEGRIE